MHPLGSFKMESDQSGVTLCNVVSTPGHSPVPVCVPHMARAHLSLSLSPGRSRSDTSDISRLRHPEPAPARVSYLPDTERATSGDSDDHHHGQDDIWDKVKKVCECFLWKAATRSLRDINELLNEALKIASRLSISLCNAIELRIKSLWFCDKIYNTFIG